MLVIAIVQGAITPCRDSVHSVVECQAGIGETVKPQQLSPTRPTRPTRSKEKADVTCLVCGKKYRTLRSDHLQQHGLTRARYRRIYGGPVVGGSPDQRITGSADPHLALVQSLSQRVSDSTTFLDALASECSERILSSAPLRAQVSFAAAQIIQARVAIHADAMGRLSRISDELGADWRVKAGGHAGRPTPTKDLVSMAMQAHAEIVKAEEMVLKAARLALDEQKATAEMADAPGFTYSGASESIKIPQDLGAADREALRALMGNLTKFVGATRNARAAITVAADVVSSGPSRTNMRESPAPAVQSATDPVEAPQTDPLAMTTTPVSSRRRRKRTA